MSIKKQIGRGALKVLRWMGLTLAREALDLIVEGKKKPVARITDPPSSQVVLPVSERAQMMSDPDGFTAAIQRAKAQRDEEWR